VARIQSLLRREKLWSGDQCVVTGVVFDPGTGDMHIFVTHSSEIRVVEHGNGIEILGKSCRLFIHVPDICSFEVKKTSETTSRITVRRC